MTDDAKPGPTGDFPDGKLTPDDEGGLNVAMGITEGRVFIDFGKSITWLAMLPADAIEFAQAIIDKAGEAIDKEPSP
jgi:hypothetical protein